MDESSGLRDRKKQRTRLAISDVATALFVERGFEAVTLAEIATAAEVSVKTIFNHFGSKEELFYDRTDAVNRAVVGAIHDRPPGATPLQALQALFREHRMPFALDGWDPRLDAPDVQERFRAFQRTAAASPALRARHFLYADELVDLLAAAFGAELGRDADEAAVLVLAAATGAALEVRHRVMSEAVLAGRSPRETRRRVVAAVDEAFTRLRAAFADLDPPQPARG